MEEKLVVLYCFLLSLILAVIFFIAGCLFKKMKTKYPKMWGFQKTAAIFILATDIVILLLMISIAVHIFIN